MAKKKLTSGERNAIVREEMSEIVDHATAMMDDDNVRKGADPHHTICVGLADEYDLWDESDRFPIWLSRVVEGAINDWRADRDPA